MSDLDVWQRAAAQLVGAEGEVTPPGNVAVVAPEVQNTETAVVEPNVFDEIDIPEPVSQDVLDDIGYDEENDEEAPVSAPYVTNYEDDEYVDDETRKLRASLTRAQKALEHEKRQRIEASKTSWQERYKRMYPLADVEGISATSRRAFEREAILSHNKNYQVLKPHIDAFREAREQLASATVQDERTNVQRAWGRPTTGPGGGDGRVHDEQERIIESRKQSRSMVEHFRNLLAMQDDAEARRRS